MKRELEEAWNSYRQKVIPRDAPKVQLVESRRAFYAGAAGVMGVVTSIADEPGNEDGGVARLESLQRELGQHVEDVKAGRA